MDIFPCTFDPLTWSEDVSINQLFGHLCFGKIFSHDVYMRELQANNQVALCKGDKFSSQFASQSSWQTSNMSAEGSQLLPDSAVEERQTHYTQIADDNKGEPGKGETHSLPEGSTIKSHNSTTPSRQSTTTHCRDNNNNEEADNATATAQKQSQEDNSPDSQNTLLNKPLEVPALDPETENAKRHAIRCAWQFLTDHQDPKDIGGNMHIEPLSSGQRAAEAGDTDSTAASGKREMATSAATSTCSDSPFNAIAKANANAATAISARTRVRDAYLAAEEGSYEAWSSVSLLSAGDNHTEKEIDL